MRFCMKLNMQKSEVDRPVLMKIMAQLIAASVSLSLASIFCAEENAPSNAQEDYPGDEILCCTNNQSIRQAAESQGCPWFKWTQGEGPSLAVLQWARKHGCPWDTWSQEEKATKDYADLLVWSTEECRKIHAV